ncbi:hypothetical protein SEA_TOMAS_29 [Streptomyces phage Tomas]|uniref:Uncharacterized protein n=1 Tax=Streptomyces phage Tomas TaxID=2914443 RepID=A0AA49BSW6_9CAUD|nr:hypothetical protein PP453_gp029 [Streptomyces phage Tomas]UMO76220.1 hypothetical protein SEA_TOMAS_29 [Streptomyces phage Tomas]
MKEIGYDVRRFELDGEYITLEDIQHVVERTRDMPSSSSVSLVDLQMNSKAYVEVVYTND